MPKSKPRFALLILAAVASLVAAGAHSHAAEFVYDAKAKRNPFIPLVTSDGRILKLEAEENQEQKLALEGIIYDNYGASYALVNGEAVKVGDIVGDYQVLRVEKDKVVFIKDGQTLEMQLTKEEGE